MTEIVKNVQKRQYVADDGSVFNDPDSCRIHEKEARRNEVVALVKKIPYFRHTPEFVDSDYTWEWYRVSSDDDLNIVKEYCWVNEDSFSHDFKPGSYPAWVAVSKCDFYGDCQVEGTMKDIVEKLHEYENDLIQLIESKEEEI